MCYINSFIAWNLKNAPPSQNLPVTLPPAHLTLCVKRVLSEVTVEMEGGKSRRETRASQCRCNTRDEERREQRLAYNRQGSSAIQCFRVDAAGGQD